MTAQNWLLVLLATTLALLALLTVLVLGRKATRDRRESRSSSRRERFRAAVAAADPDALEAACAAACRSGGALLDLAVALDIEGDRLAWPDRFAFQEAARATGLTVALDAALASRRAGVRGRAVLLLGGLRLPGTVTRLEPLLADSDPDVRLVTVAAIARAATPGAAEALVRALITGRVPPERVIERLGARWAVPTLLAALADPSTEGTGREAPRVSIARALGLSRDVAAEPALNRLLLHGTEEERISAARALGEIGLPESRPALTRALRDPSWALRAQAAKSLGELRSPRAARWLERCLDDRAWWVRANAANALRRLGPDGLVALERALHHPDRYARDRAREALVLEQVRTRALEAA